MTTTQRRIALLTGASIAALGIASPSLAAPHYPAPAPHDSAGLPDGAYPGESDLTDDTLVICDLASDADACFFGVIDDTGAGNQTATVNSVLTGQIEQIRAGAVGPESISITNATGDSAEIGAVAIATSGDANADLSDAISQFITGDDDVTATVDNNGTLLIDALAVSYNTDADAFANLTGGIVQYATSTGGDATLNITNDGPMAIVATAVAFGTANAYASAANNSAIEQDAAAYGSGNATNNLTNNSTLNIGAYAIATATSGAGSAYASLDDAIGQSAYATGGGDAANNVTNAGTLTLAASAAATGTDTAFASAVNKSAIEQDATAYDGGDATNTVANALTGVIDITALADAYATGSTGTAQANAQVKSGIEQDANAYGGGNAANVVNNDGALTIAATALASAPTGATATASNTRAIDQSAYATGGGDATNAITNGGTLDITAYASANATTGGVANASATVKSGIDQDATAYADGADLANATNSITSAGALNISAVARADGYVTGQAYASVSRAVSQSANAFGGGDATNTITIADTGSLDIAAAAYANGQYATAIATVDGGPGLGAVVQNASATGGGNAVNTIANAGELNIAALAIATGDDIARAYASVESAISQVASATSDGDATNLIDNDGTLSIAAVANANGGVTASAYASVDTGIYQYASATGSEGDATSTVANAGTLTINATAVANAGGGGADPGVGGAVAYATVVDGVSQYAYANGGGDALASLSNAAAAGTAPAGSIDISAVATAISTTAPAYASASLSNSAIWQSAYATGGGNATANISNGGMLNLAASAYASGSLAIAHARANYPISQDATATSDGNATASITNSGELTIGVLAQAISTRNYASAYASIQTGISQNATATGSGLATASLDNSGTLAIGAAAYATAETYALALAGVDSAIAQSATGDSGGAVAELANSGPLDISAVAHASGNSATAVAYVSNGISQSASATGTGNATAVLNNGEGGVLSITADAVATAGVNDGYAYATIDGAILQYATADSGIALASLTNAGTMGITANATAHGATVAGAIAAVNGGIEQNASATTGYSTATLVNTGTLTIGANANAVATSGGAGAYAAVKSGIEQFATGSLVSIDNNGAINIAAVANATGTASAVAYATALGADQVAGGSGAASFVNGTAGAYSVTASANASASGAAGAAARAGGLSQSAESGLTLFANDGVFNVLAAAYATGSTGAAFAGALGHSLSGNGDDGSFAIDWTNTGTFAVAASATAPATAYASAVGVSANVDGATPMVATEQAALSGSMVNDGTFSVLAHASGGGTFTTPTAMGTTTVVLSSANATGIYLESGVNTMTVTNTGALNVEAMTAAGGGATATGIRVVGNGTGLPPGMDDVFTFTNNGGDIRVRQSMDGGTSWQRGLAIDVSDAPNPSVINLLGDGSIYGNIEVADGDNIFVESGTTYFDGIIGPSFMPDGGVTEADLDTGLMGVGTLTIQNDGNLVLADPRLTGDPAMYDGPAYAFVDTLTVAEDGTITFELQPEAGGTQPVGTYPQVFADVANLEGTLVADITPANGLFADDYFWDNVIDANTRNGGFDGAQCVIAGPYAGSVLLSDLDCIEDADDNIDLAIERIPFDEVPGLNKNGTAVGEGLECIYDPDLTGGIVDLLADLFLFTDEANYNVALNQLAGSSYANYLQSFQSLGVHYNDLADKATSCEIPSLAGSVLECRASSPLHLWGQVDYQWRKTDGDSEAGSARAKRWTALIGMDASVGGSAILGASLGKVTNNVRDRLFGDKVEADGWQVGAYGVYDPGAFYVKAMTTYSWFDGDSRRRIDFTGLAPTATFAGVTRGDPDVKLWTVGLHGGARMAMSENSVLTPYLNLDYVSARLDEFIETGLDGANLHVDDNKESRTFLTAGVKWATQMGGVVPEVNLGYRHRFGDTRSTVSEAFLCQTDTPCEFDIVSAAAKRGTFLAGLSIGGKMGMVDLRLGYEGEFNSDVKSHSGNFKIVVPLGGRAAPPPPPPVVEAPPPPPPPPPATQTCPDGSVILATDSCPLPPPPPPPPPPAPERG